MLTVQALSLAFAVNLQCSIIIPILRREISLIRSGRGTCPSHTASKRRCWGLSPGVYDSVSGASQSEVASQMWLLVLLESLTLSRTLMSPDPRCSYTKQG